MEDTVKRKAVISPDNDGKKRDEFIGIRNLRIRRSPSILCKNWHENTPWRAKVIARLENDKLNVFHKRLLQRRREIQNNESACLDAARLLSE